MKHSTLARTKLLQWLWFINAYSDEEWCWGNAHLNSFKPLFDNGKCISVIANQHKSSLVKGKFYFQKNILSFTRVYDKSNIMAYMFE